MTAVTTTSSAVASATSSLTASSASAAVTTSSSEASHAAHHSADHLLHHGHASVATTSEAATSSLTWNIFTLRHDSDLPSLKHTLVKHSGLNCARFCSELEICDTNKFRELQSAKIYLP